MCRPPPSQHAPSDMRDRTESDAEQDPGGSSWRAHGFPMLSRAFEWPTPERDEPPPRAQPRLSPGIEPPPTPTTEPPGGPEYPDPQLLRPIHYPDSSYGRHRSAPLYGSEDWDRRVSFGRLPPPGTPREASSSRVVLPPVRHLLGELGMLPSDDYERGPVLPQLRLPDEPAVAMGSRIDEEEESERRTDTTSTQLRGKRGRVEKGEERRVVRKIYVACDFCRGRKLRCDGGRPRCSNCETRSLVCQYQEHPRRRGPGKAPKGSRGKKAGRKSAGDPDEAGPSSAP